MNNKLIKNYISEETLNIKNIIKDYARICFYYSKK